ncbi:hypothetical protein Agub_g10624 [Astrephomene gubernaculifera]|uniref:Uncharacterized protein n=1 Tax=Astrephomene gubernaculifera TaxID=47775 RepID=A0AAD3DX39_9CHLO|nr:hypothetical protein Agub_g10624 [Astrephomene gubernaculifera]
MPDDNKPDVSLTRKQACVIVVLICLATASFPAANARAEGGRRQGRPAQAYGGQDTMGANSDASHNKGLPEVLVGGDTPRRAMASIGLGEVDSASDAGIFVVPVLPYGLSNQIIALKEALALASLNNWTVVTYGFWPHYSELEAAGIVITSLKTTTKASDKSAASEKGTRGRGSRRQAMAALAEDKRSVGTDNVSRVWQEKADELRRQARGILHDEDEASAGNVAGQQDRSGLKQGEEEAQQRGSHTMPFDLIFDRQALAPMVRVISREDAIQQQVWPPRGRADALILLSKTSGIEEALGKAKTSGLFDASGVGVIRNDAFRCDKRGLAWVSAAVRRHRWVLLYSYRRIVPPARSSYRSFAHDESPCARAYHEVSLRLSKSPVVAATAHDFVAAALAAFQQQAAPLPLPAVGNAAASTTSSNDGYSSTSSIKPYYIALHVRPYPDDCLKYFVEMTSFDANAAAKECQNPLLLVKMVPLVRKIIQAASSAHASPDGSSVSEQAPGQPMQATTAAPAALFLMAHPRVRDVVRREFIRLWELGDTAPAGQEQRKGSSSSKRTQKGTRGSGSRASRKLSAKRFKAKKDESETADTEHDSDKVGGRVTDTDQAPASQTLPLPRLFFLDVADLPAELRHRIGSNSLLSMVEQEICRTAHAFIGTAASSISVIVAQERVAADTAAVAANGADGDTRESPEMGHGGDNAGVGDERFVGNASVFGAGRVTILL